MEVWRVVKLKEPKRIFSVQVPEAMYERVDRLQRNPRFRSLNQVVMEALRRALPELEREFPVEEEEEVPAGA